MEHVGNQFSNGGFWGRVLNWFGVDRADDYERQARELRLCAAKIDTCSESIRDDFLTFKNITENHHVQFYLAWWLSVFKYLNNLAVAISCLLNAILAGKRYEMLSSRSYRAGWSYAVGLIELVFGAGHCKRCYEFERDNFDGIQD